MATIKYEQMQQIRQLRPKIDPAPEAVPLGLRRSARHIPFPTASVSEYEPPIAQSEFGMAI